MFRTALIAFLASAPMICVATPVTLSFTGTVTSADGLYASVPRGATITGNYTFDFQTAEGTTGTIGSASGWTATDAGGPGSSGGDPITGVHVFTSTASVDGIEYRTATTDPEAYAEGSSIIAQSPVAGTGQNQLYSLSAAEAQQPSLIPFAQTSSLLQLIGPQILWTPDGLPLLSASADGNGAFSTLEDNGVAEGSLQYTLTSLNPVPLPSGGWMLMVGVGTFAWLQQRRRRV